MVKKNYLSALQDGSGKTPMELALRAQEARQQEVEERPELCYVVLNGGTGEDQPVASRQAPYRLNFSVMDPVLSFAFEISHNELPQDSSHNFEQY